MNLAQLEREFALARKYKQQIPCLKLNDGMAPISLDAIFGPWISQYGFADLMDQYEQYFAFPRRYDRFIREWIERGNESVVLSNISEAEEFVHQGVSEFLAYRFAGMKKWNEWIHGTATRPFSTSRSSETQQSGSGSLPPPPSVGPGGGLQVQVSCLTPGLRIQVAPAYFINWVVFGSPTSPVTSYVLPGRYVFGGDGPMLPSFTQDLGIFCIPPTYHASLTRF